MRSPTFTEIWSDLDWFNYWLEFQPARTREYFKFRSVCRMAIWIPLTTAFVYMALAIVSVYS